MVNSRPSESSIETNNPVPENSVAVGQWLAEMGIEPEKAVVWPHESRVEKSIIEQGNVDQIVGLTPRGGFSRREEVSVAPVKSHEYTGECFDFEYGWALADDIITSLEPQIDPENNLHTHEYPDLERRDKALDNAFGRITDTTDRLLNDQDSTVLYSMDAVSRYEMPELAEDIRENQLAYAERIASHLEERGFEPEIHYNPEASNDIYISGQR